jgi:hypothetical protein
MSNHANHRIANPRKKLPTPDAVRAGYNDARNGLPFRPEYDAMTILEQGNYEAGRLHAVHILSAGLTPPAWNKGDRFPPAVNRATDAATEQVGVYSIRATRAAYIRENPQAAC